MSEPAIHTDSLSKSFLVHRRVGRIRRERTTVTAVSDVSLTVEQGEIVGYIGPNGAGKSTTIKMMTGILQPTGGVVRVAGLTPLADRVALAARIGVVFGQRSQLWWDLPLADSFDLLHHIYRTRLDRHRQVLADLVDRLELGTLLAAPVRSLSLGQRMRGELAAALLHEPEVLFLDEPTIGLDVVSKHAVRTALTDLNAARGVTIVLTTHDLADVERLCPRLVIIDHGRVIHDGAVADLVGRGDRVLVVDLADARAPLDLRCARWVRSDGPRQWLAFHASSTSAADVLAEVAREADVLDLRIEEPEIEEIVRRIYLGEP